MVLSTSVSWYGVVYQVSVSMSLYPNASTTFMTTLLEMHKEIKYSIYTGKSIQEMFAYFNTVIKRQ